MDTRMSDFVEIYRDSDQVIEQRVVGGVVEERRTWLRQTDAKRLSDVEVTAVRVEPVADAFESLEHPLPTLGPDLGNGTKSVSLTGLIIGQTYIVKAVSGTMAACTLDGNALLVNPTRNVTSFKATAESHEIAATGTTTAVTVKQITAPALLPPNIEGVNIRAAIPVDGSNSNYAIGSPTIHQYLTDGTSNTGVGNLTQQNITTGQFNVAIGAITQRDLTTGRHNTAAGTGGQQKLTTGRWNTAAGSSSQLNLVDGNGNTSVGYNGGNKFVGGDYNTTVGSGVGNHASQTDVNGSVIIGVDSTGTAAYTTADDEIALGTPLHRVRIGSVGEDEDRGLWALGAAKSGEASPTADPTYLTFEVDGDEYHVQTGPQGSASVTYGTTAGTAAEGDDSRITGAVQSSVVDAEGDLLIGTAADTVGVLAIGAAGTVLTSDGDTAEWAAIPNPNTAAQTISAKTDSYTLVAGDAGALVTLDKSSAVNLTVDGDTNLAVGQRVDFAQLGTGQVTVVQGSGATVNGTPGLKLRARYSAASVVCIAADTYLLVGDLSA